MHSESRAAVEVLPELLAALGASRSHTRAEIEAFRVTANEGLGKNDELGASCGGIAGKV